MLVINRLGPALLAAALAACATAGPTPAAGRDPESVRQEIQRTLDEHAADFKRGGPATILAIYTDDVLVSPAGMDDIRGRAAMETFLSSFFSGVTTTDLTYQVREVSVHGDTAFTFGTYTWTFEPRGQPAVSDRGRFSTVWVRQPNGSWKIRRSHSNSSVPAAGGPPLSAAARAAIADTVRRIGQTVFSAGRARDPDRVFAQFSPRTTMLHAGRVVPSWPAHQEEARAFFRTLRAASYEPLEHEVDVLAPDVALWRGRYRYSFTDTAGVATSGTAAVTWVFAREDGRWRIGHVHVSDPPPDK